MLGAGSGTQITVDQPAAFDVTVISATADPLTKFGLQFFMTEEQRESATSDLCVVDISGINATTRPAIARFVVRVIESSDRPPWTLTHHVGFRLAVLLRLKVRWLWRYWEIVDESER